MPTKKAEDAAKTAAEDVKHAATDEGQVSANAEAGAEAEASGEAKRNKDGFVPGELVNDSDGFAAAARAQFHVQHKEAIERKQQRRDAK